MPLLPAQYSQPPSEKDLQPAVKHHGRHQNAGTLNYSQRNVYRYMDFVFTDTDASQMLRSTLQRF
jgi:hypothetical protein